MKPMSTRGEAFLQILLLLLIIGMKLFAEWWRTWDYGGHETYFGILDFCFGGALAASWFAAKDLMRRS
jgi:hypothetical protein